MEEKIEIFINSFRNTSRAVFFDEKSKKLIHPGEFGVYREKVVKDFLKFFIPQNLEIGSGFIISQNDEVSSQCDIVIFDKSITPLIQSSELQTFYPAETVVGIGEIKSVMSKTELADAVRKLAKIKKIKSDIQHPNIHSKRDFGFDPKTVIYDSIFTFIICEKFSFKLDDDIEIYLNEIYAGVDDWHRHNLILSLEDGLILYNLKQGETDVVFYHPIFKGSNTHRFMKYNEKKKYHHIKTFAMSFFDGISHATVLYPEMVNYLLGFTPVN